jgi:hypothetical protein
MQPDVPAQLAGLRRILEQVVEPAVGDAHAALQLRAVKESLDQLAFFWPRARSQVESEHAELRALLCEVIEALARQPASPERDALHERIRRTLRAGLDRSASP